MGALFSLFLTLLMPLLLMTFASLDFIWRAIMDGVRLWIALGCFDVGGSPLPTDPEFGPVFWFVCELDGGKIWPVSLPDA